MYVPKTRQERVLVRACQLIAEQANPELIDLMVAVAITQADDEIPVVPRHTSTHITYVQHVVEGK